MPAIYKVSFVDSVQRALNGDAKWLGVMILIFSGIWPYVKILLTLYCWFMPYKVMQRRIVTLKTISWLSRLTLFDPLGVGIFMVGIQIQLKESTASMVIPFATGL